MSAGKKIICFLSSLILGTMLVSIAAYAAGQGTLVVNIVGMQNDQGVVRISIYNSADTYRIHTPSVAVRTGAVPIHNGHAVWRVKNLPYGEYAALFYQDEDNSNVFKKNFLGIPKENYGWSGESHSMSLPSFDNAKFTFDAGNTVVTVRMQK